MNMNSAANNVSTFSSYAGTTRARITTAAGLNVGAIERTAWRGPDYIVVDGQGNYLGNFVSRKSAVRFAKAIAR